MFAIKLCRYKFKLHSYAFFIYRVYAHLFAFKDVWLGILHTCTYAQLFTYEDMLMYFHASIMNRDWDTGLCVLAIYIRVHAYVFPCKHNARGLIYGYVHSHTSTCISTYLHTSMCLYLRYEHVLMYFHARVTYIFTYKYVLMYVPACMHIQ